MRLVPGEPAGLSVPLQASESWAVLPGVPGRQAGGRLTLPIHLSQLMICENKRKSKIKATLKDLSEWSLEAIKIQAYGPFQLKPEIEPESLSPFHPGIWISLKDQRLHCVQGLKVQIKRLSDLFYGHFHSGYSAFIF